MLFRSLFLGVLDNTITPMGKRAIRQWVSKPLTDIDRIRQRLDAVEIFVADGMRRAELRAAMKSLNDMERLINCITGGVAIPRDLIALQSSLEALPTIFSLLPGDLPILGRLHECAEIRGLLQRAISPDSPATLMTNGVIRRGYSEELDEVYAKSTGIHIYLQYIFVSEKVAVAVDAKRKFDVVFVAVREQKFNRHGRIRDV